MTKVYRLKLDYSKSLKVNKVTNQILMKTKQHKFLKIFYIK